MTSEAKPDAVDVAAVLKSIRETIAEKKARGLLSDEEVREIAEYRLEPVLGAHDFSSPLLRALLEDPRRWNYEFDKEAIYRSRRGGSGAVLERIRRWLRPVQKLFWNPTPMISSLSRQADLNTTILHLLHNLAEQATRLNLEVTDLRARLLQLQGQLEMQARREKALEELLAEGGPTARRDA
jgi:hypothetical protein